METFPFSFSFPLGNLRVEPVHLRIEQLRPVIAAHRHSNSSYELHYTYAGTGTVTVDGRTWPVEPDTLYVTGPQVLHAQYSNTPITEYCLYLRVEQTDFHKNDPLRSFADTAFWMGEDGGHVFPLLKRLADECREKRQGWESMQQALLTEILVTMARLYGAERSGARRMELPSRAAILPAIEDAFFYRHSTLTLPEMAAELSLSERQVQRILREHFGKTFTQKRTEARLSAAVQLLRDTDLSITQISDRVGYSSIEQFSAAFHKNMGCSPRDYRKNMREGGKDIAAHSPPPSS